MPRLDRVTRTFWRVKGRPVDLTGREQRLAAPMHDGQTIGDSWLQAAAAAHVGAVREQEKGAGLLADMSQLDGPDFTAANLQPEVRDFYEHTSDERMRRGPSGTRCSSPAAIRVLPGAEQPSVHVAFPLEVGNVQVFLRPRVLADGALELSSPAGSFGEDGAYVVVEDAGRTHAARAPIHETFRVFVDPEGVLRTDHVLRLWSSTVVRLHYRLAPALAEAPAQ